MTTTPIMPMPGLHLDVPFPTYRQWDAMNHHSLNAGPTPAHIRWALDHHDSGDTPAMVMGRALHMALLEPSLFSATVKVAPDVDRRTKAGKEAWEAFVTESDGAFILTADQMADVRGMAASVKAHPGCRALVESVGPCEVSLLWRDAETGVMMKNRPDKFLTDHGVLLDVKTARSAEPWAFGSVIKSLGYHRQLAMGLDGLRACGRDVAEAAMVVVENEPPYAAAAYSLDASSEECGRIEYRRSLEAWAKALKTGEFNGYPDSIDPISVPPWALRLVGIDTERNEQ